MENKKPEKWKWVEGFKGLYKISTHGRVKSFHKNKEGKILSAKNKAGYKKLTLCKNGKHYFVKIHRLVAENFIPNPEDKPEINHKDCDKHNNHVSNLEWTTKSENTIHAIKNNPDIIKGMIDYNTKIKPKIILQLNKDTGKVISEFQNTKEAERKTGVCSRNILQVANKKEYKPGLTRKQAGGYKWVFKEECKDENNRDSKRK